MSNPAPSSNDFELDLELFGLELEYQIQTRIRPHLKATLDQKDAQFRASLEQHPDEKVRRERLAQEHADYQRRKERRQFVESGEAARAAAQTITVLAQQLAQCWQVLLITPRHAKS